MPEYVTIRRWALKDGADEAALVALVRERIIPAYREQPGCLKLELLRMSEPDSFLAVTHWESRGAFEVWAGPPGQEWRDRHRGALERWLELMAFQSEWDAEMLATG
ncbi:MAG TPA: antibiotic biosynthesis monooxygenase family protein [Dehalococcoidia bacterium]|nr:antibiotic biosynthesis monooxygenase family protein [Dehalococcoidia bacterium]